MALLVLAGALFVAGVLYLFVAGGSGTHRRAAVRRFGRLLWGATVASLVSSIAYLAGLLWFLVGGFWMLAANSDRFSPDSETKALMSDLYEWPYEHVSYALTGTGDAPPLRPPV